MGQLPFKLSYVKLTLYSAALESIFPQSELSTFVSFSRLDKEAQLNGLSQLVTGIRLFNKTLKKGGDTIEPGMIFTQDLDFFNSLNKNSPRIMHLRTQGAVTVCRSLH